LDVRAVKAVSVSAEIHCLSHKIAGKTAKPAAGSAP
jgi:hypothetical protein